MWVLPDQKTGFYDVELQLPDGVKCEQCILQVILYRIQYIFQEIKWISSLGWANKKLASNIYLILFYSGRTILQTVGVSMKMVKSAWAVDHRKRSGHVQI